MVNLYTIATRHSALATQLNLPIHEPYAPMYQARPGIRLPIILYEQGNPVIVSARWGCSTEVATMPLHLFPMEKILSHPPFNRWIHTQRCLVPANCFFARSVTEDHRGAFDTYLIRLLDTRVFLMGGLYTSTESEGARRISFLLFSTESADVLRPVTQAMPVIMTADHLQTWLSAEHLSDIMHLADRSGEHWFDFFPVSHNILQPGVNDRRLLRPTGLSMQEMREHSLKLKALDIRQDRFDRKGSKH